MGYAPPLAFESRRPEPWFAAPDAYTPKHLAERILTSKAALEGELTQVTVLFADLKGSMELLADRDPEEPMACWTAPTCGGRTSAGQSSQGPTSAAHLASRRRSSMPRSPTTRPSAPDLPTLCLTDR